MIFFPVYGRWQAEAGDGQELRMDGERKSSGRSRGRRTALHCRASRRLVTDELQTVRSGSTRAK